MYEDKLQKLSFNESQCTLDLELKLPKIQLKTNTKGLIFKAGVYNHSIINKRLKDIEARQQEEMEKLAALFLEVARTQMVKFASEYEKVDLHIDEEDQITDPYA